MITIDRIGTILKLALPIAAGLGSSLVMVFVDLAMVGVLGDNALAGIGLAAFSYSLILAFVVGFAPAVQGIVARRRGQGSAEPKCLPLNGGLLLALVIGVPLSLVFYVLSPFIFSIISSDPEVTKEGLPYFRALITAIVASGMCSAFQGYYTGIAKVRVYMLVILFISCLNVFLNYALIFGNFGAPALGTMGAGIASAIAIYVGAFMYFVITFYNFRAEGFLNIKPKLALLIQIIETGMPESVRLAMFALGYIVFYWIVGQVGTAELAVTNVLVRISMVLAVLAEALGMVSTTLVSSTLGKGDPSGAAQWGWDTGKVGVISITFLALPMLLFPDWFLAIFITDADTRALGIIPLRLLAATIGLGSLIYIFAYTLISLGDGKRVLIVSFSTQWLFFLPAVWIIGPYLNYGLLEIWIVQMVYGALATILITAIWSDGRWKAIKI